MVILSKRSCYEYTFTDYFTRYTRWNILWKIVVRSSVIKTVAKKNSMVLLGDIERLILRADFDGEKSREIKEEFIKRLDKKFVLPSEQNKIKTRRKIEVA